MTFNLKSLPEPADETPKEIYNSLGSFWTRLYDDKDFIKRLSQGAALLAEQLKIEFAEASACLGREGAPTYARTKYAPMIIKKSQANTGSTTDLVFGMSPVVTIGPQASDSEYTPNVEFHVGGKAPISGFVAYPILGTIPDSGVLLVTNDLAEPDIVMSNGSDFYIRDGSIIFREDRDPFGGLKSYFQTATIEGAEPDTQLLLWARDSLQDVGYLKDHFGHLYDGTTDDLDYYKEVINASGDLYAGGTNTLNMKLSLGRLFATPVAVAAETITDISQDPGGTTYVVTPNNLYKVRDEETLLPAIVEGYTLTKGEFMTNTLRFYWTLDPDEFAARNGSTLDKFKEDFPTLRIGRGASVIGGLSPSWDPEPIIYYGVDNNGNPRYTFPVSNDAAVTESFWNYVFEQTETQGIPMYSLFSEFITTPEEVPVGTQVGTVSPAAYFINNLLYANASALVVEFDALPQYIRELDVYQSISAASAVYTGMLITIRSSLAEEDFDLGQSSTDLADSAPAAVLSDVSGVTGSLSYYDVNVKIRRIRK